MVVPCRGCPPNRAGSDELRRALDRARRASGLTKHLHIHMLRHTWASHCILRGIPSRVVMLWGGWTSEAMLALCAHLAPGEVGSFIQRIAPTGAPLRVVKQTPAQRPRHRRGTAGVVESKSASQTGLRG
ncbi:MAG: site-specific integrase [Deltaproteobacteria bacterium]|nr:site-specific integrase [Deltaproteobacteria bacterium]